MATGNDCEIQLYNAQKQLYFLEIWSKSNPNHPQSESYIIVNRPDNFFCLRRLCSSLLSSRYISYKSTLSDGRNIIIGICMDLSKNVCLATASKLWSHFYVLHPVLTFIAHSNTHHKILTIFMEVNLLKATIHRHWRE